MAEQLHLMATTTEHAKELFKKLKKAKICRGCNHDAMYAACRKERNPRTYTEIGNVMPDAHNTKKRKKTRRS
uniref:Transcription factor TFIIB cyclin-like domain-containing protein n=1 Tax=Leersia perrieri TaxID=77586 RepID=A0A0D9UZG0_9ORYZ